MTLHEFAERGDRSQILRKLEREMDVDINEKVEACFDRYLSFEARIDLEGLHFIGLLNKAMQQLSKSCWI